MTVFSKYSTIIFDLDGTLVDSVPDLALALNQALTRHDLANVSNDQVRTWVGNGSAKLVARAAQAVQPDLQENEVTQIHATFLGCYADVLCEGSRLYEGVAELLEWLSAQGKQLALLTNKPEQFLPELLENLGLAHYFNMVIGGDSLAEKKPSPLPLLHITEQLGARPESCIMVGDSRSDIVCAQQAKIDCVALLQGYHQGVNLEALAPTYLFADIRAFFNAYQG
ncbi:MAG: phosphoglycolate phosphatase [Gammaproteobacteria bacterium]|nr:phosphoglycolate phosphatase [Gammaproteobacteria bacterium]